MPLDVIEATRLTVTRWMKKGLYGTRIGRAPSRGPGRKPVVDHEQPDEPDQPPPEPEPEPRRAWGICGKRRSDAEPHRRWQGPAAAGAGALTAWIMPFRRQSTVRTRLT